VSESPPRRGPLGVALGIAGAALVVGALGLEPDPRGYGTHEQLGLPPCGFLPGSGIPCPTCGVTTAFTLVAHGRPIEAVAAQPFGALLGAIALALPVLLVASCVAPALDPGTLVARARPWRIALALLTVALASWGLRFL